MKRDIFLTVVLIMMFGDVWSQVSQRGQLDPIDAKKVTIKGPDARKLRRMIRERNEVSSLSRDLIEKWEFQFNANTVNDPRSRRPYWSKLMTIKCYGSSLLVTDGTVLPTPNEGGYGRWSGYETIYQNPETRYGNSNSSKNYLGLGGSNYPFSTGGRGWSTESGRYLSDNKFSRNKSIVSGNYPSGRGGANGLYSKAFELCEFASNGSEWVDFDILVNQQFRSPYNNTLEPNLRFRCRVNTHNGEMVVQVHYGVTPGPTYYGYIKELQ